MVSALDEHRADKVSRRGSEAFLTYPPHGNRLATGDILIAVGTDEQLAGLRREAGRVGTA